MEGGAKWTKLCKEQINRVHLKNPALNGEGDTEPVPMHVVITREI